MAIAKINGRSKFFNCDSLEIVPASNGRWSVTYNRDVIDGEVINEGHTFTVVGGRKSGGSAHEWFCHHPLFYGDTWVPCKSMVRALELGIAY
jgi:hypothetical protein